jgi:hypothetical protein
MRIYLIIKYVELTSHLVANKAYVNVVAANTHCIRGKEADAISVQYFRMKNILNPIHISLLF